MYVCGPRLEHQINDCMFSVYVCISGTNIQYKLQIIQLKMYVWTYIQKLQELYVLLAQTHKKTVCMDVLYVPTVITVPTVPTHIQYRMHRAFELIIL